MWRISTHALTEGDGCIDRRRKVHEISTHALTEGDHLDVPWRPSDIISTHALTEGDELCDPMTAALGNFNSRPHGGRLIWICLLNYSFVFQLTPSRRATIFLPYIQPVPSHFNSRPHGGRLWEVKRMYNRLKISTHALTEGDRMVRACITAREYFNSRPHGGRRQSEIFLQPKSSYFNSRPHGGRQYIIYDIFLRMLFQLTPSRRATGNRQR